MFSKRLENIASKGEIAPYVQFLLFPTMFSKDLHSRQVKLRAQLERGLLTIYSLDKLSSDIICITLSEFRGVPYGPKI